MYVFHLYYLFIILILLVTTFLIGRFFRKKNDHLKDSLQATSEKLTSFFDQTSDAINITNMEGELMYVNSSFEQLYGWHRDELIGKLLPIIPAHLWEEEKQGKESLLQGNAIRNWEAQFLRKDGSFVDVNVSVSPLRDTDGEINGFAAITRDMSEKKHYERKLLELAFYDPITGAANRKSFYLRLAEILESGSIEVDSTGVALTELASTRADSTGARSVALLYLDCDRFQSINDTIGHMVGDELLQQLVSRIQRILPAGGSLFRLGGDEFAIILEVVSSNEEITHFADELMAAIRTPWSIQGECFEMTCSIGISLYPQDGLSQEDLIANAHHALYEAKAAGGNAACFYLKEAMEQEAILATIEHDLKDAITNGNLYLVYQPEVDLETGAVMCLEVLLRYEHPVLGTIPPAEFIPIAEQAGLIDELTSWLMEQVGEQAQQWQENGFAPMRFAINISPVILQQDRSFSILLDSFQQGIIHPSRLEVEITEEVFLENLFDIMDKLYTLKEMGVTVSLDEFETDYDSIDYLKHLPIDKVKIDRSVIQSVLDEAGQAKIKSIIALDEEQEIALIAVGVETQEQINYLMASGLKQAQGYFFSKPLRAAEIEAQGFLRIESGDFTYSRP